MKLASAFLIVLVVLVSPAGARSSAVPAADVLDRASRYVVNFVAEFSTVVAEERYTQESHPPPRIGGLGLAQSVASPAPRHVDLRSDFLFVRSAASDNWLTFRDVFSVDGRAVRDRQSRLAKLFDEGVRDPVEQAWLFARESFRYNIGSRDRTVANPLLAMTFLEPAFRSRFVFALDGIDAGPGKDVWIVKFAERARPTIIRTADNRDAPASGRIWIDGATGRVLQTELRTAGGDRVMTIFSFDERLQLEVPSEMRDLSWDGETSVTGVAKYDNYRRFGVTTDESFR